MASKFERLVVARRLPPSFFSMLAVAAAAIATAMSGCCGSSPTHGCKFVHGSDASADTSADVNVPCGFQICEPGVTTCCLQQSPPLVSCIPIDQICMGQSASCAGDKDCPSGSGLHCCGIIATAQIQCQADCSGALSDGTIRVCQADGECPPERPTCGQIIVGSQKVYACLPPSSPPPTPPMP
jgi:hypothetical protein